jgi:hypothetical protein
MTMYVEGAVPTTTPYFGYLVVDLISVRASLREFGFNKSSGDWLWHRKLLGKT